jgi:hypothetical protein
MYAKRALFSLLLVSLPSLYSQAPSGLQATSATRSQVVLTWNAVPGTASYQLERKTDAGAFAAVGAPVSATSATDTTVNAYSTYTYHVRVAGPAVAGKPSLSVPSNDVIVGPAPTGFNVVAQSPHDAEADYGIGMAMTLDADDDPVYAWIFHDPNRTNTAAESILYVASWDRAHYKWRQPAKVDVIGDSPTNGIPISLALDTSTGQLAMAWLKAEHVRQIAFSNDNGVTWTQKTIATSENQQDDESNSVALANGKVYLAYFNNGGVVYISGNASDDPSKWTHTTGPAASGGNYRSIGHLAIDTAGQPAIAYLFNQESGGTAAYYWRPGSSPVQAFDSKGVQNDSPSVRVAFAGTKPRILFSGLRDDKDGHNIWISASDDGATWSDPVVIPPDGNRGMQWPMTIAYDAQRGYAVVSTDNGGNWDGVKCKWPKLSLSSDAQHWTTCSPASNDSNNRDSYTTAEWDGNHKLYLGFRYIGDINALMIWHEGATPAASAAIHK